MLWIWPLYLHVNEKSDGDDVDDDDESTKATEKSFFKMFQSKALGTRFDPAIK